MRRVRAATAAALLALVAACGPLAPDDAGSPDPAADAGTDPDARTDVATEPRPVGTPAPEVAVDRWLLPSSWAGGVAVDPSWDRVVGERGGVVLGAADLGDGAARLSAVDAGGRVLWTADRPAGHDRAGLSTAGGAAVAVLTEPSETGDVTATGYALATGARLWGPVEVPGPVVGPGLVLGERPDDDAGRLVALDPATGAVVAEGTAADVVAEADGWVLTARGGELSGTAPADRTAPAWTTPTDSLGLEGGVAPLTGPAPPGTALLATTSSATTGTLVEVSDGSPVVTRVAAARVDSATGTRIALGAGTVSGHGPEGPLWSRPVADDAELAAVGGALVYLREGDAVRVLNALTGADAVAYEGEAGEGYVVPTMVTSAGSAVARTDRLVVLTTGGEAPPS